MQVFRGKGPDEQDQEAIANVQAVMDDGSTPEALHPKVIYYSNREGG
jgi:hypothetical protein